MISEIHRLTPGPEYGTSKRHRLWRILWTVFSALALLAGVVSIVWGIVHKTGFLPGVIVVCIVLSSLWILVTNRYMDNKTTIVWLIFCAFLLGMGILIGEQKLPQIAEIKREIRHAAMVVAYGGDTLPEGNLYQSVRMHDQPDVERLVVKQDIDKTLYLRGFVGDNLENGVWKRMQKSDYNGDSRGMLRWLSQRGFYAQAQYDQYLHAGDQAFAEMDNAVEIQIKTANRKYLYVPYSAGVIRSRLTYADRDNGYFGVPFLSPVRYDFIERSDNTPAEFLHAQEWITKPAEGLQTQYMESESEYRNFVYNHYLGIDDETKKLMDRLFEEPDREASGEKEQVGIYVAAVKIREVLEKVVDYDPKLAEIPRDQNPILWFVVDSGKGNDALYASTAVMAFRNFGIPARYAEGYLVSGTDTVVTSKDAHAWCEVYMDGIGWVPVDVVPGYYYDVYGIIEHMDDIGDIKKTSAKEEEQDAADEILQDRAVGTPQRMLEIGQEIGSLLYGVIAVILIVLVVFFLLFALVRTALLVIFDEKRKHADADRAVELMSGRVFGILMAAGISPRIGWNVSETERAIRARFRSVAEGEYVRLNAVLEKYFYGKLSLELYEEDELERFLEAVSDDAWELPLRERVPFLMRDTWFMLRRKETL